MFELRHPKQQKWYWHYLNGLLFGQAAAVGTLLILSDRIGTVGSVFVGVLIFMIVSALAWKITK